MGGRLIVLSNAADGRDDEFNDWYDHVHLGEVLALGPFTAAQRFRLVPEQLFPQQHRYLAIYEFEGSAEDAVAALRAGAAGFAMSDALADPVTIVVEDLTGRVTAG
jgi:hypothetical protein